MRLDANQEIITPRVPQFSAELNVENLCGKQTTQLKVLIVTPNGCFALFFRRRNALSQPSFAPSYE